MLGIIVQLAVSWLIIWLFEKGNLNVLGLLPTKQRLLGFCLFLLVTACCSCSDFLLKMYIAGQRWLLNPGLSAPLILEGIWWNVKSVLFEELIFRGVLLYILIRKWGMATGVIISAIGFGIYHWFSFEVVGKPVQMIIVFLTTGTMGLLYAYAYAKTRSLYIPAAIHLGWNLVQSVVFSQTVIGKQVFIPAEPALQVNVSYAAYYTMLFFPLVSALLINYRLLRKRKALV